MKVNKKLVLKALTDPKFRKMLEENPMEAVELAQITGGVTEVYSILSMVNGIDNQIALVGDELLCTNSGTSCGIC